jgi:transitional endoplasmic reticulum ATPase
MNDEQSLEMLRQALSLSPDNLPLRRHFADTLARLGRHAEAAAEYREAIRRVPGDSGLKLALARCFFDQSKNSEALVIVEELVKDPRPAAGAFVLHARLLLRASRPDAAARQYRRAVELDETVADEMLARELGVDRAQPWSDADESEFAMRAHGGEESAAAHVEIERPSINFEQVGGMDRVKDEIRMKIIHPLEHPDLYKAYGKAIGGGILMYGPPGCGKTHLARATAGQVKAGFMSIGINDVLDMWIGSSEKQLHDLFESARRNRPCVLFFDEVDALAASRSDMKASGGRHVINQFLAELDGVSASNEGVLVLAATNAPWHLDSAFRRPGRFDRVVFVPPPDEAARAQILRIMLLGKPSRDVDHEQVARKTEGFSGADLKSVVDIAIEGKLREALAQGTPQPLTNKDLLAAARQVKPSTREWFSTARNYALYSNQGGAYDDVLEYLKIK